MTGQIQQSIPVIGWDATDDEWHAARRYGLGGSDISAVLDFSSYRGPWAVWAEKAGVRHWDDESSAAADLGTALEPWLVEQASLLLRTPVHRTPHRMYSHPQYPWRMCSPDAEAGEDLVECKTAGLASGWGTPSGWADGGIPLGYEFQCRWSLHVLNRPRIHVVALVAGMGLLTRTIVRDHVVEADLVAQVSDWHQRHIVEGVEPPLGNADNTLLAALYPKANGETVHLDDTDAVSLHAAYLSARQREAAAKADKETAGAALKALLGANEKGTVDDQLIVAWSMKKGAVDWPRLVAGLVEQTGAPAPNPEAYRKPETRFLSVKD